MANQVTANPWVLDTAMAAAETTLRTIKLIQWVDTTAEIVDDDDLAFTLNGATVAVKFHEETNVGSNPVVAYQAGPFHPPLKAAEFQLTVIDGGALIVWFN